jgi:hypothetical protein
MDKNRVRLTLDSLETRATPSGSGGGDAPPDASVPAMAPPNTDPVPPDFTIELPPR